VRRGRRPAVVVGDAVAAFAPYIGAAAAVPHGGSNLPPWPTAVGCRGPLATVGHGGFLANRRGARWLVAKFAKMLNGCIILQNDYIYIYSIYILHLGYGIVIPHPSQPLHPPSPVARHPSAGFFGPLVILFFQFSHRPT
jgi:hypothetical protein